MSDFACNIPVPSTPQELEEAIRHYRLSDLQGSDLFSLWQAIRNVSLALEPIECEHDRVAVEHSY